MSQAVQVFIDDRPLSTIVPYSGLSWTTRWPGGDYDASWTARVPKGWRHSALRRGASVQIRYGGLNVWRGTLSTFDRDSGQMAADGLIRRGEDYDAVRWDITAGATGGTWNPRTAVDEAITPDVGANRVAIGWTRDTTVPDLNLAWAVDSSDVMRLDALLELATSRGHGTPYMGPDGVLRMLADPTTPTWFARPKVVDLGEAAGDQRATHIFVDYMQASGLSWVDTTTYSAGNIVTFNGDLWQRVGSGAGDIPEEGSTHWAQLEVEPWDPSAASKTYTPGTYYVLSGGNFYKAVNAGPADLTLAAPPSAGWTLLGAMPVQSLLDVYDANVIPYREERVNAVGLGDLPSSEATAIANQALATALAPSFTSDIPATPLTVTDARMQPANPILLRAGTLGRVWGASHPRLGQAFIDVIAGEVTVSDAETDFPSAVIKPWGKQAQSDIEVMEAALNARRSA